MPYNHALDALAPTPSIPWAKPFQHAHSTVLPQPLKAQVPENTTREVYTALKCPRKRQSSRKSHGCVCRAAVLSQIDVPPREHLVMSRDTSAHPAGLGGGSGTQGREASDAARHPTTHRAALQHRLTQPGMSVASRLRNPGRDMYTLTLAAVLRHFPHPGASSSRIAPSPRLMPNTVC